MRSVESCGRVARHHSRFRVRAPLLQEGEQAEDEDQQENHGNLENKNNREDSVRNGELDDRP